MSNRATPIFCPNLGVHPQGITSECCFLDDQTGGDCGIAFGSGSFWTKCPTGNCVDDCQNAAFLYESPRSLNNTETLPFNYWTCANLPNVAHLLDEDILIPNVTSHIRQFIPQNTDATALANVTSMVTRCLTGMCDSARDSTDCENACLPVKLFNENMAPDLDGISDCIYTLCHAEMGSIPFADSDVIGIGVCIVSL